MSTSNPWGAPTGVPTSTTTDASPTGAVGNGAAHTPAPAEFVDPNDPRLTSENVAMNTQGDAYAQPAPPPDNRWRARLSDEGVKNEAGQVLPHVARMTKGTTRVPYLMTTIKATIISPERPEYDGIEVFDSWVSTFTGRDGASKISTILGRLTKPDGTAWAPPGTNLTHQGWMELFHKALQGNPEVYIETQWESSCQKCGEVAEAQGGKRPRSLTGMTNHPPELDPAKRKAGHLYKADVLCTVPGHGVSRARPRIAGVSAVK